MTWTTSRSLLRSGLIVLALGLGCGMERGPTSSDSKTNWMMSCETDSACGSDLACICGVCTQSCEVAEQCKEFSSDATCISDAACGPSSKYCAPSSGGTMGDGSGGEPHGTGASAAGGTPVGSGGGGASAGGSSSGGVSLGGSSLGGAGGSGGLGGGGGLGGQPSDCGCVSQEVRWGYDGGLVAYVETNELSPCGNFQFVRSPQDTDPISEVCEVVLEECGGLVAPGQVQSALEHPDVLAAIAAAPVLYGQDNRPVDGAVLRIDIDGSIIEVGDPCATCTMIPEGIIRLAALLEQMTAQVLDEPACEHIGP